MIEPLFASDNLVLAGKLLDAAVLRQQAIAANIANAETPGYRRLDVAPSFETELRASLARDDLPRTLATLQPTLAVDARARNVRPDGNSVELESELLALNRNTIEHDFLSEVVSHNLKQLKTAITGRTV